MHTKRKNVKIPAKSPRKAGGTPLPDNHVFAFSSISAPNGVPHRGKTLFLRERGGEGGWTLPLPNRIVNLQPQRKGGERGAKKPIKHYSKSQRKNQLKSKTLRYTTSLLKTKTVQKKDTTTSHITRRISQAHLFPRDPQKSPQKVEKRTEKKRTTKVCWVLQKRKPGVKRQKRQIAALWPANQIKGTIDSQPCTRRE